VETVVPLVRRAALVALVAIAPVIAAPLAAQTIPVVSLSRPEAEFAEPFDQVTAVRELRDGRVIVSDLLAKGVSLVDFRTGSATAIGREGQGPGEFAFPTGLVPLPGDTTLLVDPGQRRFLKIAPDGKPVGTVPFPEGLNGIVTVRGADRQGRIYVQGSLFGGGPALGGPDAGALPDSVALLRWTPGRAGFDTLGRVKVPSIARAVSGGSNARAVVMRQQPFSASDDWSAAPDGRVAVARAGTYHVEWLGAAPVSGPAVSYAKVPVTQADKDAVNRQGRDTRGRFTIQEGGGGGGRPANVPPPQLPEPDWPEFKPAFVGAGARMAPNGEFWVQRSQPAGAGRLYDVCDGQGKLTRQVRLAKDTRLVGFGATSVYVARTDNDDELQYLQRFRRP
jgi:hypothetical protein